MPLVPCHFDLQISSYGLWLKVPFVDFWKWPIMLRLITFCESISWTWSVKMSCRKCHSLQKWALDGIFLINHVEVMPWSSYSWLFQLSKYGNFCILRLFEPYFENHDQELIKWCLWLQNKMLTKNLNFWLSNDHFAPTVDCSAIRVLTVQFCAESLETWHEDAWPYL